METGDLLLFNYEENGGFFGGFNKMIQWGTHSNLSHVAMILKDPKFIHPSLKGMYVWESSWEGKPDPQDGKIKLGVQITPFGEIMESYKGKGKVMLRKLHNRNEKTFDTEKMIKIHEVAYDKPYDIIPSDWIGALFKKDSNPQKTSRFWCSALIGYIYTKCGILDPTTDWSILTPNDFSLSGENLKFINDYSLDKSEEQIQ